MCGIAGYFGIQHSKPNTSNIINCIKLMKNRGPDFQDFYKKDLKKNSLLLINSRLKIIDKSDNSNQPMIDKDGVLVFNGLIYNYLEIRDYLKKFTNFKTNSDTEVLLKLLGIKGEKGIELLDGMWSLAYYSFKTKKVIISRDRFGEKPLYYLKSKNFISFASSPNFILELINKHKIDYLKLKKIISHGPRANLYDGKSLFKDIKVFKSNRYTIIDNNINFDEHKYWHPEKIKINNSIKDITETKEELLNIFETSFKKRLRSDYKISSLLSGGIDSNIVTYFSNKLSTKKIKCFSIKSESKHYDESNYINNSIKFFNINHQYVKPKKISFDEIEDLIKISGSIFPTITWLLYHCIAKKIKNSGIKTIIQGNGGDELFGGYYTHYISYLHSIKEKSYFKSEYEQWSKYLKKIIRSRHLKDLNNFEVNIKKGINPNFHPFSKDKNFLNNLKKGSNKNYFNKNNFFKNILNEDIFLYTIPNQLICSDAIAMYNSLENRSPFLSKDLYEFSFKLPNHFLISNGYTKNILRQAFQNKIPNKILKNREKIGFFGNIKDIINFKEKKFVEIILDNKFIKNLVKEKEIIRIINKSDFIENKESHFIFSLLNISLFLNIYDK